MENTTVSRAVFTREQARELLSLTNVLEERDCFAAVRELVRAAVAQAPALAHEHLESASELTGLAVERRYARSLLTEAQVLTRLQERVAALAGAVRVRA